MEEQEERKRGSPGLPGRAKTPARGEDRWEDVEDEDGRPTRKKIKITQIDDKRGRQTTFTKRKQGLMKKARELSVLCGCEIAILMTNLQGKLLQFDTGSMDRLVTRYHEEGAAERFGLRETPTEMASSASPSHAQSSFAPAPEPPTASSAPRHLHLPGRLPGDRLAHGPAPGTSMPLSSSVDADLPAVSAAAPTSGHLYGGFLDFMPSSTAFPDAAPASSGAHFGAMGPTPPDSGAAGMGHAAHAWHALPLEMGHAQPRAMDRSPFSLKPDPDRHAPAPSPLSVHKAHGPAYSAGMHVAHLPEGDDYAGATASGGWHVGPARGYGGGGAPWPGEMGEQPGVSVSVHVSEDVSGLPLSGPHAGHAPWAEGMGMPPERAPQGFGRAPPPGYPGQPLEGQGGAMPRAVPGQGPPGMGGGGDGLGMATMAGRGRGQARGAGKRAPPTPEAEDRGLRSQRVADLPSNGWGMLAVGCDLGGPTHEACFGSIGDSPFPGLILGH